MTALYITLMILAVIMIIIFIPVDCVIDFSYNRDGTGLYVFLKYAFLKFKIVPSEEKVDKQKEQKEEKKEPKKEEKKEKSDKKELFMLIKTVYDELRDKIFNLIGHLFRHTIRIKELNISSRLGTGDPMYTGIALGGVNALIYNVISLAYRYTKIDKWNVSIDGDFDNTCIMAGVYAVIRTRVAYVIKIGIMAAILLLRIYLINRRIKKNG